MSQIQEKLDAILNARSARCRIVDKEIAEWQDRCERLTAVIADVYAAEQKNPEIAESSKRLRDVFENIRSVIAAYDSARSRFARNTLCIGIGGAARMGKSTFLQSVTGLDDTQIPTSDKYFTTAVRSQIENSLNENVAVADFHSESSFLRTVVEPMCRALRISCPMTFDEFRRREFRLADGERSTQESEDILQRLRDAQKEIRTYERLLTGERGKRIPLGELRPYVAYPEGGRVKAGPFLAISDLVIKSKFPEGLACEMESAAIAHTCYMMQIPFMSIRVISDTPGNTDNHQMQWDEFLASMSDRSFQFVRQFLMNMPAQL